MLQLQRCVSSSSRSPNSNSYIFVMIFIDFQRALRHASFKLSFQLFWVRWWQRWRRIRASEHVKTQTQGSFGLNWGNIIIC